ncbi:MAG TPA: long-chain fatty acid--CoA ligase [Pyrinomonadaceae bacterium]
MTDTRTTTTTTATEAAPAAATTARAGHAPLPADEPRTLVEVCEHALRARARPDAFNYKRGDAWLAISSGEFALRVRAIALGLHALGVGRGDRVAILSESSPEWVMADVGCQFAGVVDVPIYPTLAAPQGCYIINDSGSVLLFVQNPAAYERVREVARGCAPLRHVVILEGEAEAGDGDDPAVLTLAQLEDRGRALDRERPGLFDELAGAVGAEDLATIIYTSGTTGEPKGVMLTHSNVVSNLVDTSARLAYTPEDVVLSVLPLSHIFERGAMYMYIYHGTAIYFAESIERIGDNMREVRPTIVVAVPRLFEKIYARIKERAAGGGRAKTSVLMWAVSVAKRWARARSERERVPALLGLQHKLATRLVFSKWQEGMGGRIRVFCSGGAALPEELGYIFLGAGLPIVQGYGLTETSPVICVNSVADNRIGTVGRAIDHVEVRIAADGEIETRGPNVMRGYYNKPEETEKVFTEDGWFKTGDIGALDRDGYLRITDRKKELFKTSGGKYIAPQPIEQRIKQSRFVNQVVLIGNGRKFAAALIVPDWELLRSYAQHKGIDAATPADLCRHPRVVDLLQRQVDAVTADLSNYERVKRIALIEHELTVAGGEMTPTLKVKRRVVDEKYKDTIDRLYEEAETRPYR